MQASRAGSADSNGELHPKFTGNGSGTGTRFGMVSDTVLVGRDGNNELWGHGQGNVFDGGQQFVGGSSHPTTPNSRDLFIQASSPSQAFGSLANFPNATGLSSFSGDHDALEAGMLQPQIQIHPRLLQVILFFALIS